MQVVNGSGSLVLETSYNTTVDIELPEINNKVYEVKGMFLVYQAESTALRSMQLMAGLSVAINKRTSIGLASFYADDIIARDYTLYTEITTGTDYDKVSDPFNHVDPVAPYFADEARLIISELNELLTSGTINYAYQIYLEQKTASKAILDDLFRRRYSPTS